MPFFGEEMVWGAWGAAINNDVKIEWGIGEKLGMSENMKMLFAGEVRQQDIELHICTRFHDKKQQQQNADPICHADLRLSMKC